MLTALLLLDIQGKARPSTVVVDEMPSVPLPPPVVLMLIAPDADRMWLVSR